MSEWLMAGVSRHILRLPPAIGKKRVSQLADRARAEVDVVSTQHRAVHHFVVRELPRFGRPMPPQTIAEGLDLPLPTVIQILTDLEARKIFLFRDGEGSVVWAYPVTAEQTPHRIRFRSGETLYAAWAADAIATPFVQGRLRNEPVSITVETRCEHCSELLTLEIDSDMNVQVEQTGAEPMVFTPDVNTFEVEAPSIVDDFWRENVFLWSEEHAREYRKTAHRTRGVYSPLSADANRIVQSAIFCFDTTREGWGSEERDDHRSEPITLEIDSDHERRRRAGRDRTDGIRCGYGATRHWEPQHRRRPLTAECVPLVRATCTAVPQEGIPDTRWVQHPDQNRRCQQDRAVRSPQSAAAVFGFGIPDE